MAIQLDYRSHAQRHGQRRIGVTRIALIGGIVVLALLQGYSARAWMLVGVAVAWAASLPLVLRGLSRLLRSRGLAPWLRSTLLVVAGLILLLGFAVGVRSLLPG